jgi:hypothetical protein
MQALHLAFVPAPLQPRNRFLSITIESGRVKPIFSIARGNSVLNTKIKSDFLVWSSRLLCPGFNRHTEPPISHGIFSETARFEGHAVKRILLEYPQSLPGESKGLSFAFYLWSFEGDPA